MEIALTRAQTVANSTENRWTLVESLPVSLTVEAQIKRFAVRDLLLLEVGTIVETAESVAAPAPILVNGKKIGKGSFESAGNSIGIRISELA